MTPIQAAYAVAEGHRPDIPASTPRRLQEIMLACWDQDSQRRPSFTYIAMALADYARMAFSPANVGALTLQIANEMLATVEGNSTVNVDFTTPVSVSAVAPANYVDLNFGRNDSSGNVGLEIE
jgi:Protein tyrosine and serine/threonine kinase